MTQDEPGPQEPPGEESVASRRQLLCTDALAQAHRAVNAAEALRLQAMLLGLDAMVLEEEESPGRGIDLDSPVARAFMLHQSFLLRISRHAVRHRLTAAAVLRDRLPRTWSAFLAGLASEPAVLAAAGQAEGLSAENLPAFDRAAETLVQEHRASQVDLRLARLRDRLEPQSALDRHERASNRRYVRARPEGDGMGVLEIHATAVDVAAAYDAIRRGAVVAHGREGECRHLGALMADIAVDLVLHGAAADAPEMSDPAYPMERIGRLRVPHRRAVQATILVTMTAGTATGADDAPAEVAGMGTVDADVARRIVQHTRTWTRVVVDPVDDAILAFDSHERYIPAALKKLIHLRMPTCAGDDCGLPSHRADLDHVERVEHDGRTRCLNLQPLCRAAHGMKDEGYLDVRVGADGAPVWGTRWGATRRASTSFAVRRPVAAGTADEPPF